MTVCAISLKKYASALASPVRSGLIVWGIILTEKVSAGSKIRMVRKNRSGT